MGSSRRSWGRWGRDVLCGAEPSKLDAAAAVMCPPLSGVSGKERRDEAVHGGDGGDR